MRFPVYESLFVLNRNMQEIVGLLDQIKKSPGIPKDKFKAYQVEIECLRSEAIQDVLEVMNDIELDEAAKLGRKKKHYYDSIRDLDDVYFDVQHREDERRKQGLPSLIGILPRHEEGLLSTQDSEERDDRSGKSDSVYNSRSPDTIKPQIRKERQKYAPSSPSRRSRKGLRKKKGH